MSKLLMNSLYGRLAMTPYLEKHAIIDENNSLNFIENNKVNNIVSLNNGKVLISYENEDINENNNSRLNTSIAISAAITAEARLYMYKILQDYNVYYTDTDSAVTDKPLDPKYVGNELGQFKLEHVYSKKKIYFFF